MLPPPPDSNMFAPLVDGLEEDLAVPPTQLDGVYPQEVEGGTVTELIPAASTMPADSPLPTWIDEEPVL